MDNSRSSVCCLGIGRHLPRSCVSRNFNGPSLWPGSGVGRLDALALIPESVSAPASLLARGLVEYEDAEVAGFTAVSLGPRILRTETAAAAALAVMQAAWGDLG